MNEETKSMLENTEQIEARLPGFPSYYETINQILSILKWTSLAVIIVLAILLIAKKVKKQPIHKGIIIVGMIAIIVFTLSMTIRMPYWS